MYHKTNLWKFHLNRLLHFKENCSPEDDQSVLIETSSCNHQYYNVFATTVHVITTQLKISHGVTPQTFFTCYIHVHLHVLITVFMSFGNFWKRLCKLDKTISVFSNMIEGLQKNLSLQGCPLIDTVTCGYFIPIQCTSVHVDFVHLIMW